MFWVWSMAAFGLWVAYGVSLVRRQARANAHPAPSAVEGPLWLLASIGALALGYFGLQAVNGLSGGEITALGWLVIAVAGLAFVHCQTTGVSKMLASASIGVTSQRGPSSSQGDAEIATQTSREP